MIVGCAIVYDKEERTTDSFVAMEGNSAWAARGEPVQGLTSVPGCGLAHKAVDEDGVAHGGVGLTRPRPGKIERSAEAPRVRHPLCMPS